MSKELHDLNKFRIRSRIVDFANDLQNGCKKSDIQFKNILDEYDYYKDVLKENSYVDKQVEIIKKYMHK